MPLLHETDLIELDLIGQMLALEPWILAKHFTFHTLHVTLHSITQLNKQVAANGDGGFLVGACSRMHQWIVLMTLFDRDGCELCSIGR